MQRQAGLTFGLTSPGPAPRRHVPGTIVIGTAELRRVAPGSAEITRPGPAPPLSAASPRIEMRGSSSSRASSSPARVAFADQQDGQAAGQLVHLGRQRRQQLLGFLQALLGPACARRRPTSTCRRARSPAAGATRPPAFPGAEAGVAAAPPGVRAVVHHHERPGPVAPAPPLPPRPSAPPEQHAAEPAANPASRTQARPYSTGRSCATSAIRGRAGALDLQRQLLPGGDAPVRTSITCTR
jgi:hypothetical protein